MRRDEERNQVTGTGLYWPDKRIEVERIALPFQVVETVNVSRATREEAPLFAGIEGEETEDWRNKLIWGENKYIMASLLEDFAGKINLIYIDPPFATGDDFSFTLNIGDQAELTKEPSALEVKAYRDTWGKGMQSYLQMMYDRLVLMKELLTEDGQIYVHCDWRVNSHLRLILDEIFGPENFVNEIVWKRQTAHSDYKQGARHLGRIHDTIFLYFKSDRASINTLFQAYSQDFLDKNYKFIEEGTGRRYSLGDITGPGGARKGNPRFKFLGVTRYWAFSKETLEEMYKRGEVIQTKPGTVPRRKRYLDEMPGISLQTIWADINPVQAQSYEKTGYATQKPEGLLERIVKSSSKEGDIIADFFCGSGTTLAVAEKLGRRWIGADLSRFAIQVTRKRLLDIPDCKPFEILNLGKYERQYWQVHINGEGAEEHEVLARYLDFIVQLYRGERVTGFAHLHGRKAGRMVHVGAVDAPITLSEINDALDECAANKLRGLDVLGWEWEMGLHDLVTVEARKRGIDLRLLTIPREVMDPRAVESGDVHFYELAYLDVTLERQGTEVQIVLKNFIIPNEELVPQEVREKTKRWSDYVDFWAVDWEYQGDTFHNQWQSYRTRKHPALRLESDWHKYSKPGKYQVMVKVIDIFGNDTTKLLSLQDPVGEVDVR